MYSRQAHVEAAETSAVAALSSHKLSLLTQHHPELAWHMLKHVAGEALKTLDVASFTPPPSGAEEDPARSPAIFQEAVFAPSTDESTQLVIDGEGEGGTPRNGTPRNKKTHNWDGLLQELPCQTLDLAEAWS